MQRAVLTGDGLVEHFEELQRGLMGGELGEVDRCDVYECAVISNGRGMSCGS